MLWHTGLSLKRLDRTIKAMGDGDIMTAEQRDE
jgi:hypothetical protein